MTGPKQFFILLVCLIFGAGNAWSLDENRARVNYMMFCQGCHLPGGAGSEGRVPRLQGFVGNFLRVEGGREFLVRVPGSANAALDATQLAELLNWIVLEFSDHSLPDDFQPYTEQEVAALRRNPLNDVNNIRSGLIEKIKKVSVD